MGKKKVAKELDKEGLDMEEVDTGLDNTECQKDVVVRDKKKKKKRSKQLDDGSGEHFASQNEHQKEDECHTAVSNSLTEGRKKNKKKKFEKEDEAERKKRMKTGDRVSGDEIGSESRKAGLKDGNPDVNPLDKIDADSSKQTRQEIYKRHKKRKHREGIDAIILPGGKYEDNQTSNLAVDCSLTEDRKKNKKKKLEKEDEAERKKQKKKGDRVSGDEVGSESQKAGLEDGNPDVNLLDKIDADCSKQAREEKYKRHKKREHREGIDAIISPGDKYEDNQRSDLDKTNKDKRKKKKTKTTPGEQNCTVVGQVKEDGILLDHSRLENGSKKKERKREKKKESKALNNIDTSEEGDRGKATKTNKKAKVRDKKAAKSKQSVEGSQHSGLQSTRKKSKKVSFADHVEVFASTDSSSESNANDDEKLVRGKRFSEEEDELVKKAVFDFIEDKELGENGLEMVLHCKDYPEIKKICWKEIAASLPWRPLASVYHRAHVLFERAEERIWTAEEYNFVKKFYEEHGADWRKLGDALGKHRFHVKDAWRRMNVANRKKGKWSQEEYQALFDLVNLDIHMKAFDEKKTKHGMLRDNIAWTAISDKMATRRVTDCCDKWYRQISSPMVVEGKWADADDYRMLNALVNLDACSMEDVDWDNLVEGRSGDLCRKRWNQMVRHIGDYGSKSFAEQVELLSTRYSPDVLESREAFDNRPVVS